MEDEGQIDNIYQSPTAVTGQPSGSKGVFYGANTFYLILFILRLGKVKFGLNNKYINLHTYNSVERLLCGLVQLNIL